MVLTRQRRSELLISCETGLNEVSCPEELSITLSVKYKAEG
jgi:hypothetical protein